MEYFQAHVIQHLLLMIIAPPLLAMGAPMTLALQTSSRSGKVRLLSLLNSRPFKIATHPLPVWVLYYFSMFAFFLTFAINYAMEHMWVMDLSMWPSCWRRHSSGGRWWGSILSRTGR
jgi:cytochrome c oxidase assembly factor CtaG